MSYFLLSAVIAIGFATTIVGQSFVLANTPAHVLWVGSFVSLGEALVLLAQVQENRKDIYRCNILQCFNVIMMGTISAFACGSLLYSIKEIGPLFCILFYCASVLEVNYMRRENLKRMVIWHGFTMLSILLLYFRCLIKKDGDFFLVSFYFTLLGVSLVVAHFFETAYSVGNNSWQRVFERIVASVELSIFGWIYSSSDPSLLPSFPWVLLPLLAVISGCGKALYDLRVGVTVLFLGVNGVLIALVGGCLVSFVFVGFDRGDYFAVISACILLICSLNSMYCGGVLQTLDPSSFFTPNRNKGLALVNDACKFFVLTQRERRLAIFFLLTVFVMFVELLYGISANSLGLISDSFHMLLDSVSIAVGLCAAFASSLPGDKMTHPFGYARYRVLGGFINAVLLLFIALFVIIEAVERLLSPPEIQAAYLIHVSAVGLIVNIIGVIFFHGADGHSHSHGECTGGSVDHNMRGVYLHILADLVGSVNALISSIIISLTGIKMADPICSLVSCIFIILSAFPLLEETGKVLLLSGHPYDKEIFFQKAIAGIKDIENITGVENICAWPHSTAPNESSYCAIKVYARSGANSKKIRRAVKQFIRNFFEMEGGSYRLNVLVHIE